MTLIVNLLKIKVAKIKQINALYLQTLVKHLNDDNLESFDTHLLYDDMVAIFTLNLLESEQKMVESWNEPLQTAMSQMENEISLNILNYANALWMDDIDYKADIPATILNTEQESIQQLTTIIRTLCSNLDEQDMIVGTNFASIFFLNLLKIKQERSVAIKQLIHDELEHFLEKLNSRTHYHCDEHAQYTCECTECRKQLIANHSSSWSEFEMKTIISVLCSNIKSFIHTPNSKYLDYLANDALILYRYIFSTNKTLKMYLETSPDIKLRIA
eukprot:431222_1